MAEVKWIKIVTDIFDDEKMLLIDGLPERDGIIVIWFKLLCMAGKQNNGGVFTLNGRFAYTDEMLATIFRRPLNTVRLALKTFEEYGMIEIINNTITIPKWEQHQSLDKMEQAKEKQRKRVAQYRERQKLLANPECNANGNVTVTPCNAVDIDKDIDIDIDKDIKEKNKKEKATSRFIPPTLDVVKAYCSERGNNVDPERFIDYYTANGWKVGKNKMKDWKATVRTWEKNSYSGNKGGSNIQVINGKEYEYKNGKYYIPHGNGIAVDPYADDDLPY